MTMTTADRNVPVSKTSRVGLISLISAILGCALATIMWIMFWIMEEKMNMNPPYALCTLILVGLEIIALVTGIAGWRSPYGKAGVGISTLILMVVALLIPATMLSSVSYSETSREPVESSQGF